LNGEAKHGSEPQKLILEGLLNEEVQFLEGELLNKENQFLEGGESLDMEG
jgi:hypothetical protein